VLDTLKADLVALQEVEDLPYEGTTVSHYLAERLAMQAHHGPTLNRGSAPYGNLLLSRIRADAVRLHDLSVDGPEPRGAIDAAFDLGGTRLRLVATHLGLKAGERRWQARQLLQLLQPTAADIMVLAGDINEWRPGSAAIRELARLFDTRSKARTFPANAPVLALDRIFITPLTVATRIRVDKSRAARRASDHLPLVCDLDFELADR
ncbi:MAG: endonuclease/exonuclease/phosphatase family protein, partial [Gammaproteobacteria bacterium]